MNHFATLQAAGKPVAYFPKLAKPLGNANAAVLFSQLLYWHDKTDCELGVYKTVEQIEDETGLTPREQETACKKLCALGVLVKTHKRLQHRMYYRLDEAAFNRVMAEFEAQNGAVGETANDDLAKAQNAVSRNHKNAVRETAKCGLDEPAKTQLDKGTLDYQENTNIDYKQGSNGAASPLPPALPLAKKSQTGKTDPRSNPDNVKTWNAYAKAYRQRYGVLPETNAKVRGQVKRFVELVGAEKAPVLAAYYVSHNKQFFVSARHAFGLLLTDYQQIATDYAIGQQMTAQQARQAESTQSNFDTAQRVLARRAARRQEQQS